MKFWYGIAMLLTLIWVAGCAGSPERQAPAPVVEANSQPPVAAPARGEARDLVVYAYDVPRPVRLEAGSAVLELGDQAQRQYQSGALRQAAATLERALRIEPRNPHLWNRLARIRLDQGRWPLAVELAAKSNALAADAPGLRRDNWSIIAAARRGAGDLAGARAAERKAAAF